jgi:hypothetical protein
MKSSITWVRTSSSVAVAALLVATTTAQSQQVPSARLVSASRLNLPGEIDSSNPAVWALDDGIQRLFVISSWGGVPVRSIGASIDSLRRDQPVGFASHPGHGVWMEAIVPDDVGVWYSYYHHERPADLCGRPDRQLPRIGAMRSDDNGATWTDLGIVIDAPAGSEACDSSNRFVLGGVGDVTAALDRNHQDLYLYFSQYSRQRASQGVAVARLAWADRNAPAGKVTIWNNGAWLPATADPDRDIGWSYPSGTPLVASEQPFHDASSRNDVFWGPSIHWNTYLEHYVMLINRAKDEVFGEEGIYISFSLTIADPRSWSTPKKILNGGEWYPQAIGTETGTGTDRTAGRRARFFMMGRSTRMIEFTR